MFGSKGGVKKTQHRPDYFEQLKKFDLYIHQSAEDMLSDVVERVNVFEAAASDRSSSSYSDDLSGVRDAMGRLGPTLRDISKSISGDAKGVAMLRLFSNAFYAGAFHSKGGDSIAEAFLAFGRISFFDPEADVPSRDEVEEGLILNPLIDQLSFIPDTKMGGAVELLAVMSHLVRVGYVEGLVGVAQLKEISQVLDEWYWDISDINNRVSSLDWLIKTEPRIEAMIVAGLQVFAEHEANDEGLGGRDEANFPHFDESFKMSWSDISTDLKYFEDRYRDMLSSDLGMSFSALEDNWSKDDIKGRIDGNLDTMMVLDKILKRLVEKHSNVKMTIFDSWTEIPAEIIARWESIMEIVRAMDAGRRGEDPFLNSNLVIGGITIDEIRNLPGGGEGWRS